MADAKNLHELRRKLGTFTKEDTQMLLTKDKPRATQEVPELKMMDFFARALKKSLVCACTGLNFGCHQEHIISARHKSSLARGLFLRGAAAIVVPFDS